MYQPQRTWQQFEDLVRRILEANNFIVQANPDASRLGGFDFNATVENETWAIDVKYYRTARAQPSLIDAAAARLVNRAKDAQAWKAMLVVSCALTPALRRELEKKYTVTFADRFNLKNWASVVPALAEELDALVEADPTASFDPYVWYVQRLSQHTHKEPQPRPWRGKEALDDSAEVDLAATFDPLAWNLELGTSIRKSKPLAGEPSEDTRGTELCAELKRIKRGRDEWHDYERICEKILRYLFPNDLSGWHRQKRTDDGFSRFDFVCRVRPTTDFWRFVIDHLNSRYVLFEFKNYSGKIKQGQILTTERYLLERGLRRAAVILTRTGAERSAIAMAQGAMREHGKLMLIVNDQSVCEMLHKRERGEDPTDSLFELADDFLLSLPR